MLQSTIPQEQLVDPKVGESVLDPACGTGGFLSNTIEHVRKQVTTPTEESLFSNTIRGVEKKPLPHLLCTTNMILHGIEVPSHVVRDNTLTRPLRDYGPADKVDVVVMNPPFGGTEEPGVEMNFPADFRSRETADLFLVLITQLLKSRGRAGIVLPDGFLFGEGVKTRIKKHLLETCNLHTIVRLPNNVFAPYTSIRTNLLFFSKGEPTKEIWYYEHPYPTGQKSYNKTNPIRFEEFAPEMSWWNSRVESEQSWKVTIEEIERRNFNLDIKNPNTISIEDVSPSELLELYRTQQAKVEGQVAKLQVQLKEALRHHDN
jgi:type I restriction enzyme M protein